MLCILPQKEKSTLLNILLRTLIVYFLLIIAIRIGGKRQIGELQMSELVSALLLSELAAMPIGHEEIPILFAVIPLITVICVEIIAAFLVTKSKRLRSLFDGKPSVIIDKGRLNLTEMKKLRLSIEELIVEARLKGISDIGDLQYAIFEDNGQLSVFKKETNEKNDKGIAHILVSDGEIDQHGLKTVNLTEKALLKRLKAKKTDLSDVILYTLDDLGNENIIRKEDTK